MNIESKPPPGVTGDKVKMQVQELIAAHLGVSTASILKVTELYKVWCVVVSGCRARFVSKKAVLGVVDKAQAVIDAIQKDGYEAKLWEKYGKRRIYVGKNNGVRVNSYGYIDLSDFSISIPSQKSAYLVAWHAVQKVA